LIVAVGLLALLTLIDIEPLVAVLPELSVALAIRVWVALLRDAVSRLKVQLLVPEALEKFPLSTETWTEETATLSEAVPETMVTPETVAAFVGALMETVGGVVSAVEFTVSVAALLVMLPAALFTTTRNVAPLSAVVVAGVV
jgi:hypothetical protein